MLLSPRRSVVRSRQFRSRRSSRAARPLIEPLENRVLLTVFSVTTTADGGPGSLRQAILDANADPAHATIIVPAGTFTLTRAGANEDAGLTGDLDITQPLTIIGAGAQATIIDGGTIDRVFDIHNGVAVDMWGITIRNGRAVGTGAPASGNGGGIRNTGSLTLDSVVISGNNATGGGGGISNIPTAADGPVSVTIRNSFVLNNVSGPFGGGIRHGLDGTLEIVDSVLSGNSAEAGGAVFTAASDVSIRRSTLSGNEARTGGGGAVHHQGDELIIRRSLVFNNTAAGGGGVFVTGAGEARLVNSTISGNIAQGLGGGIAASNLVGPATVTVNSSTITNNSAGQGGGIGNSGSTVRMRSTIVAGNSADTAGPDIFGVVNSLGHNLIQSMAGAGITGVFAGNILEQDPRLGPLADNGGPTLTHALLPGSPAIEAGDAAQFRPIDQRGVERPQGDAPDIGAFESTEPDLVGIIQVTTFEDGVPGSLRQAILDANATPGRHTIMLPAGVYMLTIEGANEDEGLTGDLDITDHLNIRGSGAGETIIDAGGLDRIFDIRATADVSISGITLRNGRVVLPDPPPPVNEENENDDDDDEDDLDLIAAAGGAIRNFGVLTLEGVVIAGNHADAGGGGLYNGAFFDFFEEALFPGAVAMIWNSIISDNTTGAGEVWGSGGGIDHDGGDLVIIGSTIERNSAQRGGGVHVGEGSLEVHASSILANRASVWGGGIAFWGEDLGIFDSTISWNSSEGHEGQFGWGGGIFILADTDGTYSIERTLISTNIARHGGGLTTDHEGELEITGSTFSRNHAHLTGGAMRISQINTDLDELDDEDDDEDLIDAGSGSARLENVTIAHNTAGMHGGGIYYTAVEQTGFMELVNVTVASNIAGITGGGVHSHNSEEPPSAGNSIFAGNRDGGGAPDFFGTFDSLGHNLVQNIGWTSIIGETETLLLEVDPRLAPLGDHGGPTPTMPLVQDSPAIDAGNDELAPETDQRGVARPQGEASDIGAFERQEGDIVIPRIIVTGAAGRGGSEVRVFDADTGEMMHSFMPYGTRFRNPITVAVADVNGDGSPDIITAPNWGRAPVRVFDGATGEALEGPIGRIFPFGTRFDGGISLATADINRDGTAEIITAQLSRGTRVRIFNGATGQQLPRPVGDFPAFWHGFDQGVTIAAGDVDGDGVPDIITGMRVGGSNVRVFSGATGAIIREFNVHPQPHGIRVAAGDLSADGRHEIITVQRPGVLRIFDRAGQATGPTIAPQPPSWPAAFDFNRDGHDDILLGVVQANEASVRVFSGADGSEVQTIQVYRAPLRSAMFVAAG